MSRFLIIDDHPLFREALHNAIEMAYPDCEVVEASSISQAQETLAHEKLFDLALLDLNIPDTTGFNGLLELRAAYPRQPIVVVSGHEDPRIIRQVMSYGTSGYITKSIRKDELTQAIRTVVEGSIYLPPTYEEPGEENEASEVDKIIAKLSTLTPKQFRVLRMVRDGLLNKQIAYELNVGETTIKAHMSEILKKLNVNSRTQVVIETSKIESDYLLKLEDEFFGAKS